MTTFELITECGRPVAAVITKPLSREQLHTLYALLPSGACLSPDLAGRWDVNAVCCTDDWASQQLHRAPCFKPKGQTMAFL